MTADQLWRAVWHADKFPMYAFYRIQFLEQQGYLKAVRVSGKRKKHVAATPRGLDLASDSGEKIIPFGRVPCAEIQHTVGLTEIRIAVQQAGKLIAWQPDRTLLINPNFPKERFSTFIPDAIWVSDTGKSYFVEYERTRKSPRRIRQKVAWYARELERPDRAADFVLWVTEPACYESIKHELMPYPNQSIRMLSEFLKEMAKLHRG